MDASPGAEECTYTPSVSPARNRIGASSVSSIRWLKLGACVFSYTFVHCAGSCTASPCLPPCPPGRVHTVSGPSWPRTHSEEISR